MENNSLPNIIVLATISASVVSLSYNIETVIPQSNHSYIRQDNVCDWSGNLFTQNTEYQVVNNNTEQQLQTMIDFSRKIIKNTKDIDSEFVDIVNDNFWDLI